MVGIVRSTWTPEFQTAFFFSQEIEVKAPGGITDPYVQVICWSENMRRKTVWTINMAADFITPLAPLPLFHVKTVLQSMLQTGYSVPSTPTADLCAGCSLLSMPTC